MSEHLEPLVAAYVAQRQRDYHRSTRGIPTPENRAIWEFDASEKIRAHDREVEAAALREAARAVTRDKSITGLARATIHTWVYNYADRIESEGRP